MQFSYSCTMYICTPYVLHVHYVLHLCILWNITHAVYVIELVLCAYNEYY